MNHLRNIDSVVVQLSAVHFPLAGEMFSNDAPKVAAVRSRLGQQLSVSFAVSVPVLEPDRRSSGGTEEYRHTQHPFVCD